MSGLCRRETEPPSKLRCTGCRWQESGAIGEGADDRTKLRGSPKGVPRGRSSVAGMRDRKRPANHTGQNARRLFVAGHVVRKGGPENCGSRHQLCPARKATTISSCGLGVYSCPLCFRKQTSKPSSRLVCCSHFPDSCIAANCILFDHRVDGDPITHSTYQASLPRFVQPRRHS